MNTAWISRVDAALREVTELRIRLKDAEERIEALEKPSAPDWMVDAQAAIAKQSAEMDAMEVTIAAVKRKPGRPRKNGN